MKSTAQNCAMAAEGLRSLVGGNGWDYCVLWKLSQDQRFLEWMGCCCCGAEVSIVNGGALFPGASASSRKSQCRDAVVQHTRTRACDALSDFPSSLPLDSSLGIYAQVLISNQPAWLTAKASNCTSSVDDAAGEKTRVLVPIPGGLVELFVAKHIAEDQNIIDIIMSQCHNNPYEEISMGVVDQQQQYSNPGIDGDDYAWKNSLHAAAVANDLHPWSIPHMPTDHGNFAWEPMADQPQLYASPLNLLDGPGAKNGAAGDHVFFDGPTSDLPNNSTVDHDQDMAAVAYQHSLMTTAGNCAGGVDLSPMLASGSGKDNRESIKQEAAARADSISEGSDEEEEPRPTGGRNGKRHHSKNLVAERKRRKKLNDRLYALRALVPKITKMDRASILGDAIEYVMELLKQVKDLQDELEDDANPEDDDDTKHIGSNCKSDAPNPKGVAVSNGMELGESPNSSRMLLLQGSAAKDPTKQPAAHEQPNNVDADRGNQMEPQVEVRQVEGNDFFLKVFCEHKAGGFVRLMEAMSSLGLEVTNANVTTLGPLVLNVFRVEKRENELLQVDQVRDSLLESARGTIAAWSEPGKLAVGGGNYLHQDAHQNRGNHHHHHHHHHHHQHLNPHNQFHYLSHQL